MIRPRYAIKLAHTKLRSKRGVLIASIIVSSLLFAALIASIIVFTGTQKSATRFVEAANDGRYLVAVQPNIPQSVMRIYGDEGLTLPLEKIREMKAFQKNYYDAERARYKAAGVAYNEATEIPVFKPSIFVDETLPQEQRVMIDFSSPVTQAILNDQFETYAKTAKNKTSDIKKLADQYGATHYYAEENSNLFGSSLSLSTRLIQDGKEDFKAQYTNEAQGMTADKNAIHNGVYGFADTGLIKRNLLITDASTLKGVPVIPSAQEIVKLFGKELGLDKEPEAEAEKSAWLKQVQEKAKGYVYTACYRNATETALLEKIQLDYAEEKANEGVEGYQKPSLIYQLPTEPCGAITIKSDTRTPQEKAIAAKLESDQKKLGTYLPAEHRLLTFEIVGVANAQPFIFDPANVTDYLKSLVAGNSGTGTVITSSVVIPTEMYQQLPEALRFNEHITSIYSSPYNSPSQEDFKGLIVAFNSIDEARRFIEHVGCAQMSDSCSGLFYAASFGSKYLLLDTLGATFAKVMRIALPVLLGLALVIIWFTISRMMAENRKESAVYRAMGARRSDIAAIYTTYTLLVALRIAIVSVILGVTAALVIDLVYAPALTGTAASMFGSIDQAPQIRLFDLSSPFLWLTVLAIFAISLIASIQPLVRNVLRPPVRDMRSE